MTALTSHAQNLWRLDSVIVENDAQVRLSKTKYEYNSKKQVIRETETDYSDGTETQTMHLYTYDDKGNVIKQ